MRAPSIAWRRRHRYCGTCGAKTLPARSGHVLVCSTPSCRHEQFPRIDPAIIVLVSDGDRALLGPPGQLAGRTLLHHRGIRRTRRIPRRCGGPRGIRGNRHRSRPDRIPLLAAVALSGIPDARIHRACGDHGSRTCVIRNWRMRAGSPAPTLRRTARCCLRANPYRSA